MSRVGLAPRANVKSICVFGKVAAILIIARFCLNRSCNRRSSRLNRDFEGPEQKVSRFGPNLWNQFSSDLIQAQNAKNKHNQIRCNRSWQIRVLGLHVYQQIRGKLIPQPSGPVYPPRVQWIMNVCESIILLFIRQQAASPY